MKLKKEKSLTNFFEVPELRILWPLLWLQSAHGPRSACSPLAAACMWHGGLSMPTVALRTARVCSCSTLYGLCTKAWPTGSLLGSCPVTGLANRATGHCASWRWLCGQMHYLARIGTLSAQWDHFRMEILPLEAFYYSVRCQPFPNSSEGIRPLVTKIRPIPLPSLLRV